MESSKIVIVYGARQVGKTTLIQNFIKELPQKILAVNADERKYTEILSSRDYNIIERLIAGWDGIFIDEAQRVPDIGVNLKIIYDHNPEFKIIASGSSSFDLANKIKEPLTGRTWTLTLYPVSLIELEHHYSVFEIDQRKEERLIYGSYPEIFHYQSDREKEDYLRELTLSYLYKDVLELSGIRQSQKVHDLLRLLAFQVGAQVSTVELAQSLQMSKTTVDHYIDLLEQAFVVFRLPGFNRNLRKEVNKMHKVYFYDVGVRNALIDNFKPLKLRNDEGQLWENFLIIERMKYMNNLGRYRQRYFWRTYTGAELDYVEDHNDTLKGYEFKTRSKSVRCPKGWPTSYPGADFACVNASNYFDFVRGEI